MTLCRSLLWSIVCAISLQLVAEDPTSVKEDSSASQLAREVESAILKGINEYRQEQGLQKLAQDKELNQCAENFARFMAETGKYGHRANGQTPAQRAREAGYQYCVIRENIAYRTNTGEVTASSLIDVFVQGWIDSPPHRENILADYVTETGVAVATTDEVTYYAVQLFGRPRNAMIELTVRNGSEEPRLLVMESNDSRDEIELPPTTALRIKRCFPTTLSLADTEKELVVRESTELSITESGLKR